jgi:hypothetical protein
MEMPGSGMHHSPQRQERTRRRAAGLACLLLVQLLLPLAGLLAGQAAGSVITTTDDGRTQVSAAISGIPSRFNVSIPSGAVVTSFTFVASTTPPAARGEVASNVTLDLGLDGADWSFGGGAEGAFGYQQVMSDGTPARTVAVGGGPSSFSFLLPRGANVSALRFTATPRVNMSLWNASEFVTVMSGSAAVPLNLTSNSAPAVGDLGGDGRIDLVVTGQDGNLHVYSRVGANGLLFEDNQSVLPSNLQRGRMLMDPVLADLNGDGNLDIVTGSASSGLVAFLGQNGSSGPPFDFVENTTYFAGIPAYANASPAFADLDGDGDLDLVVGASDGSFVHYRNEIGEGTGVSWRAMSTFIPSGLSVAADASPSLVDLDGDGDSDMVSGAQDGSFSYFENRGNASAPWFAPAGFFAGLVPGARSTPTLQDWDLDGRPDLFYGARSGLVYFAASLGGLPADLSVQVSGGTGEYPVQSGVMSGPVSVDMSASLLAPIASASLPLSSDGWGNALESVSITLNASHFGDLEISGLEVEYSASLNVPELADAFRAFARTATPVGNQTVVPIQVSGAPLVPATAPLVLIEAIAVRVDDAPAFVAQGDLHMAEDTAVANLADLSQWLADEEPLNATYSVVSSTNDTYVAVSISGGHFLSADAATGDLNNNWTGSVEVVVRAVDARGQSATSGPVTIRIDNVEDPPVVEYIASQYLGPADALRVLARAIDGDADAVLRYSLLPPTPASAQVDSVSGLITWNPTSAERMGSARVVVAATDGVLADTQAFDVYFLPTPQPVFSKQLPRVSVLPGRPEFMNVFDFATGNVSSVRSMTLHGPPHPHVNLSSSGEWLAFDYPADFAPGSDRVELDVDTPGGNESVAVDVSILPTPAGLTIAPFPPTPLARGVAHRVEMLRYVSRVTDFRNLSFEVNHSFAEPSGFNLTFFVPADYAPSSLLLPVTARAGLESVSVTWTIQLEPAGAAPRIGRLALVSAGARDVDLAYALGSAPLDASRFPLTTDSAHLAPLGLTSFRVTYPPWPAQVRARDFWPIERDHVFDAQGNLLLEVEIGYDGRSRYIDRVQYFSEDDESVVDGSFAEDAGLTGVLVHNISLAATGPFLVGPLEPIVRLDGRPGVGWQISFTKDTRLEQLTLIGLTDPSGVGGGSLSFGVWAVVTARDDPPTYRGGLTDITVEPGFNKTVDLSVFFEDEEGNALAFSLSASVEGVLLDRASGWLVVDGNSGANLTGVQVVASESTNRALFATSQPINIRVEAAPAPPPSDLARTTPDFWAGWMGPLVLFAALAAVGAAAFALLWWRLDEEEESADAAVDGLVASLGEGEQWEAVAHPRPPPTAPPNPDDPQMQALEAEWSRVIASRQGDASTAPGDSDSELHGGKGPRRPVGEGKVAPLEPPRPARMSSSDTETERRAGETDPEIDVRKRRVTK